MPPKLHTYTVTPLLPERLAPLRELADNLRWAWDNATRALFRALGGNALWEESDHNPRRLLGLIPQSRLDSLAADPEFLKRLDTVWADFVAYRDGPTWWSKNHGADHPDLKIAYFSAEFGLTECLPIYSGGLGILAGDHLKAASDLGLPLVGVGFLYQRGYFRQGLNADGWQVERYPAIDFYSLPLTPVLDGDGDPLTIAVAFPGRHVFAQVWKAQVGRIPLYLLDTNIERNAEADRHIAGNLYGGDNETRIQQELVLGIGGMHALAAIGITPTVCHMNEGHSAFLALERVRRLVQEKGLPFDVANSAAAAGSLFTTHTPVPAGFDLFSADLMWRYFGEFAGTLGLGFDQLMERGRHPSADRDKFNMAVLAFRHARFVNGVSALHGEVSRRMAASVWHDFPLDEVPIGHVTNGIHTKSFLSDDMEALLAQHGALSPTGDFDWSRVESIPDASLWGVRERRRSRLVAWVRSYCEERIAARGGTETERLAARELLDPSVLTIGFARRFATYKRGDLLLRDVDRLIALLTHPEHPVQLVFAGKAHPRDDAGKELIRRVVHFTRDPRVRGRIVFLEDYDIAMARHLVQGVDVWLNNPRRPMEASGTSGMKVIPNGGLNCSVLDGWWVEGYDPSLGWAIGRGEDYADDGYQDHVEAQALYALLEGEIAPLFYRRDPAGLPTEWLARIKASMRQLAPRFSTERMVREYAESYYLPAARLSTSLSRDDFARARTLVAWKQTLRGAWSDVRIEAVEQPAESLHAGERVEVGIRVRLGGIVTPADVRVELYAGPIDADRRLTGSERVPATLTGEAGTGVWRYTATLPSVQSGRCGFAVRVLPHHPDAVLPQELPLIVWE